MVCFTYIYSTFGFDEESDKNDGALHNFENISDFEGKVVCIPKAKLSITSVYKSIKNSYSLVYSYKPTTMKFIDD